MQHACADPLKRNRNGTRADDLTPNTTLGKSCLEILTNKLERMKLQGDSEDGGYSQYGNTDRMITKLTQNCQKNILEEGVAERTQFMRAASRGQAKLLHKLIRNGSKVDETDSNGWTAFVFAVKEG